MVLRLLVVRERLEVWLHQRPGQLVPVNILVVSVGAGGGVLIYVKKFTLKIVQWVWIY